MINLVFFLTPIIIIVAVIVIEFWLRRKKQKTVGTTADKTYIAVRLCSGVGGFAAIWISYSLLIGLLKFFLGGFASAGLYNRLVAQ
jgi:hypothetical protein